MQEKELMEFVLWLPKNIKAFQGMSPEEVVAQLNVIEKAGDGTLEELIKAFKSSKTTFKLGGKLDDIKKFKPGGLTRREAIDAYMKNNEGVTRSQARQAYRNARNASYNLNRDVLKTDGYANRRDWARQLIAGNTNAVYNSEIHNETVPVYNKPVDVPHLTKSFITPTELQKIQVSKPQTMEFHTAKNRTGFNQAFAAARRLGLKRFKWHGGDYGTILAPKPVEKKFVKTEIPFTPVNIDAIVYNEDSEFPVSLPPADVVQEGNHSYAPGESPLERMYKQMTGQFFQNGGVVNTPNGPIFETEDGHVDSYGRSVNYQPSKISQWRFNRDLQRKWENDALAQTAIDGKVILDMFGNQPWKDINRAAGKNPQMEIDTVVVRTNDDGSVDRERAQSFKTFWSRKIFGDSKFDKMNRQYEKESSK